MAKKYENMTMDEKIATIKRNNRRIKRIENY